LDELEPGGHSLIFAVGSSEARRNLAERFGSFEIGELRSRRSRCSRHAQIGEGAIICEQVIIEPEVRIGRHFHANIYSYVAHECTIGDFVTFAPRASCNGNIKIGDGAYIGSGAVIRQGTRDRPLVIGENATVGMGAVVTRDVPANTVVVGNPARPLARGG
jgi:sugar O-acyltransferase (sialic acid O-acetyltransferase NeuD family)